MFIKYKIKRSNENLKSYQQYINKITMSYINVVIKLYNYYYNFCNDSCNKFPRRESVNNSHA